MRVLSLLSTHGVLTRAHGALGEYSRSTGVGTHRVPLGTLRVLPRLLCGYSTNEALELTRPPLSRVTDTLPWLRAARMERLAHSFVDFEVRRDGTQEDTQEGYQWVTEGAQGYSRGYSRGCSRVLKRGTQEGTQGCSRRPHGVLTQVLKGAQGYSRVPGPDGGVLN